MDYQQMWDLFSHVSYMPNVLSVHGTSSLCYHKHLSRGHNCGWIWLEMYKETKQKQSKHRSHNDTSNGHNPSQVVLGLVSVSLNIFS